MIPRVHDDAQLGKTPIGHVFLGFSEALGPPDIVPAGMGGFETRRVRGSRADFMPPAHDPLDGGLQQARHAPLREQPARGFLQCRVVRHRAEFDSLAELRRVFQHGSDSAVVRAQVGFEHQAGEELVLGELPRTEPMSIRWQGVLGCFPGFPQHLPW